VSKYKAYQAFLDKTNLIESDFMDLKRYAKHAEHSIFLYFFKVTSWLWLSVLYLSWLHYHQLKSSTSVRCISLMAVVGPRAL